MNVENKTIVYTYIPPKQSWIDNISVYSFELYSMSYSATLIRKNFKVKSLKLFSTKDICEFFDGKGVFDQVEILGDNDSRIEKQNAGSNHPNMLYKMVTVEKMFEPFLHVDNDLFLNDPNTFDNVGTDILFAYEEDVVGDEIDMQYYDFYYRTYLKIVRSLNDQQIAEMGRFNPKSAFNCCIFGGPINVIKSSFARANKFFRDNYQTLNPIPNMPGFIEQYLQSSFLRERVSFYDISFLEPNLLGPSHVEHSEYITTLEKIGKNDGRDRYKNIEVSIIKDVMKQFKLHQNFHLSSIRWYPHVSIAVYNLLNEQNPKLVSDLESIYGKHSWCFDISKTYEKFI